MSLLMKALKKAEHAQKGSLNPYAKGDIADAELTLAPMNTAPPPREPAYHPGSSKAGPIPNQAAANLFLAKNHPKKSWLALLITVATVLIAGGGLYLYFQIQPQPSITPLTPPVPLAAPDTSVSAPAMATAPPPQAEPDMQATGPLLKEIDEQQKTPFAATRPATATRNDDAIKITQTSSTIAVSQGLTSAYQALREGKIEQASSLYQKLLGNDPGNIDALLGLASIAAKRGKIEQSAKYYVRVLELDPKNVAAQAGLISFMEKTDPASSESRLKQLLQNQPAAFLFFALGNLHAAQSQWQAAEQAYFQALQMEPGNPDYAFNLAVSLEHLNQSRHALPLYQQALKFMQTNSNIHFDKRALIERINQLSSSTAQDTEVTK